jgi:hypothetical protein
MSLKSYLAMFDLIFFALSPSPCFLPFIFVDVFGRQFLLTKIETKHTSPQTGHNLPFPNHNPFLNIICPKHFLGPWWCRMNCY